MKTNLIKGFLAVLPFVAMSILSACSSDEMGQIEQTPSSLPVNFHVRLKSFDAATRAAWKWADGSVVYLQFYNGENVVRGYAIYDESTESWSVPSWAGTLGSAGKCEFYFFDGVSTSGEDEVLLSTSTPVYADRSGSYTFDGSSITITGTLIPTTSRIRFSGAPDIKINISGITCYSSYDALTNRFESSSSDISLTVGTDGYTPYVYGVFTDANTRQLSITNSVDGENTLFVRAFPETSFQVGESGYVTIPFKNANRGWSVIEDFKANTLSFSANGVTFNMKFVKAGTFQMGSTSGDDDEQPVHQVTLTRDYYMGETEVTQALWYAVMGQSPTSDGSQWNSTYGQGDNYPAYYISYNDCESFLTKLNQLTGQTFRFPTEAEWEFAARGGNYSNGYIYSGSNTIDDVAWCGDNSEKMAHPVAQKAPNELGLYDMSGNVWEWCYDWYGSYSSSAQTDPTGAASGSHRVLRGGGWDSAAAYCRVAYRSNNTPTNRDYYPGFRLALGDVVVKSVSSDIGIGYGGVDENGELDPAVKKQSPTMW